MNKTFRKVTGQILYCRETKQRLVSEYFFGKRLLIDPDHDLVMVFKSLQTSKQVYIHFSDTNESKIQTSI